MYTIQKYALLCTLNDNGQKKHTRNYSFIIHAHFSSYTAQFHPTVQSRVINNCDHTYVIHDTA
jgi:hypothetical protein